VSLPIKQLSQFSRSNQDLRAARRKIQELHERIKRLEEALREIANEDYRGSRSTESQIAFRALEEKP
jgi:hypothetical protein